MLIRLLEHVVDPLLPVYQCPFRRRSNTIDMIFIDRQLQKKCRVQHQDFCMAFINLIMAFDAVNRDLLFSILCKFGCPPTFVATLQQFHTACVLKLSSSQSSSVPVDVEVKQGCVLAPTNFNLFLDAITLVSHRDLQQSNGVGVEHRLDGDLFNVRCHQSKIKTSSELVVLLIFYV